MPTKVLEFDLADYSTPVKTAEDYQSYYILVRYRQKILGWMWINYESNKEVMPPLFLQENIKKQLGPKVVRQLLPYQLGMATEELLAEQPVSVIVCTHNRADLLEDCLKALLAMRYSRFEVIVVDNAPVNDDTRLLCERYPVRYVVEPLKGLDRARNRGIAEAQHAIVAFTDDDARADRYWLQIINRAFTTDPSLMCVTGNVGPAEINTPAQFTFEKGYGGMSHGFRSRFINPKKLSKQQLLWASGFGVGANMAFRKEVFDKVGLFDPSLDVGTPSHGGGDIEMFHRVVAKGFPLLYEPDMFVWHIHRRDTLKLRKQIQDNGRSFGCYLLTCIKNKTVTRTDVAKFLIYNWLLRWIIKNMVRPPRHFPRHLAIIELAGFLKSPFAYSATQKNTRRLDHQQAAKGSLSAV